MSEPELGFGNFLDYAHRLNPNRDVAYAFTHELDQHGAVVLTGHSLSDLVAIRDRYARWYRAHGVRPGEPIALVVAEGLEPILHLLALSAVGAITAPINDQMAPDVLARYLAHIDAVGIVADDPARVAGLCGADGPLRPRFLAASADVRHGVSADGDAGLAEGLGYHHGADDVVALIHSSGTTGVPKASQLTHRRFWDGKQPRMVRFPAEPYDRLMSLMPHTHAGGLSYFLTATLIGLPTVVMSSWTRAGVEPVMEAFQPTMMASFPRTFVELGTGDLPRRGAAQVHSWFNTGDSAHYGHVRRLVQLGQRPAGLIKPWLLPREQAEQTATPGSQFIDGLGSTEMGMALFGFVMTPETARNDRCVGRPTEVVDRAAVLDASGRELPDGEVGLLGVIAPSITPGYWHNRGLTDLARSGPYWLTGDVVRRDAEGNFYHLDRTVDVIESAAGPVYSLPLEEVLLADCADRVRDCAVIGVPASDGQARPIAVVQLQACADSAGADELLEAANKALVAAGLAELAAVRIARTDGDFPLGPTGKVLKRELRERHATALTGV